jgi:hypothetical protein
MQKSFLTKSLVGLGLVLFMAIGNPIFAQRDAGAKMRGEFGVFGNSASRSMQNARAYYQDYRAYVQSVPAQNINPEVAKHVSDGIGDYIEKSQKHMAWMRKQAAGDKETLASIDSIDKHLADAAKSHKDLHGMCLKETVDAAGTMACCQTIDKSLEQSIAEHDKLMKRLKAENPAPHHPAK